MEAAGSCGRRPLGLGANRAWAASFRFEPSCPLGSNGIQGDCRCSYYKLWRQHNAKPSITVAAPRRRESASSAATELYILIVTATAKNSLRRWTRNFIGAPLKHIADHVVQAPRVGLETAHWRRERIPVIERKRGRVGRFAQLRAQR